MKFGRHDFVKLRGAVALCVLLAGAGAAAALLVVKEKRQAELALAAAEGQRNQNTARLRQSSSEEQEIKAKAVLFQDLIRRGIVGSENRLDWIELLRELRDRHRLPSVDYEIAPQQKLQSIADGYEFQSSTMRLGMRLLHEEDLLRLLGELRRDAKALIVPRECTLARLAGGTGEDRGGIEAQLRADCSLQWITVRRPEKAS